MTHVCFFYLYLQLDLFVDRQFINPNSLQIGKPYLILDVQHIATFDGPQLVARLVQRVTGCVCDIVTTLRYVSVQII
jgi:hypothetical protein